MPLSTTDGIFDWQRLAVVNKHPRDTRITFDEASHKYTIDGSRYDISCTGFVHSFFGHFDADEIIKKMMSSRNWKPGGASYEKYKDMTPDEIKQLWADSGAEASGAGTRMHLDVEHYYNAAPAGNLMVGSMVGEWEPLESKEWDYFMAYEKQWRIPQGLVPFRTEWLVFNDEIRLAGSIDMVYAKPDGTYAIYDWKRSKEIKFDNKWQKGLAPIEHLDDCNYWHYSLQLNNYRRILEKFYGVVVSELALVILHPNNRSFQIVKLNMMDDEVEGMWAARAAAVAAGVPGVIHPIRPRAESGDGPAPDDKECLIQDDSS